MNPAHTIDVGDQDFEREVLERSAGTPVVVDFWAPWCGPCKTLGPMLERLAAEHAGAFILAKVNVDEAPAVAQAFGIKSIPAVKGFLDGQIVGEFVGAQPEAVVRQLIGMVLPTKADQLVHEAEALAASDAAGAEVKFGEALATDGRHGRALVGLAKLLAERDAIDEALALLERVPPTAPIVKEAERLAAAFRTRADGPGDEADLRTKVAAAPDDLDARLALGRALAAQGRHEEALTELLDVIRRDRQHDDEGARKTMIDLFAVLGSDHPLTERFRGELAKVLFR